MQKMERISSWDGANGGSQDNYPQLLKKCQTNFDLAAKSALRRDYVSLFDDFLGDLIGDEWNVALGNGGATAGAIVAAKGGIVRLTSDDSAGTVAADAAELTGELNWYAENGELEMEARVKIDAITTVGFFVGFTDTKSLEAAFVASGSGNGITSNATDGFGFMFDTGMTDDNIWLVGVKNNTDVTHEDSGVAPVAATYIKLGLKCNASGTVEFYINDVLISTIANCVTPSVALCPSILVVPKTTAVRILDVDYVHLSMAR